ncbi:MAG: cytochrome c biogenesis protein CcsA [Gemmatimonadota bacterium]|jgi:heme exporter protein C|nr:MAG: cytochrome c biogenesis protein CcsA [Gemmatimonadota bacterium]
MTTTELPRFKRGRAPLLGLVTLIILVAGAMAGLLAVPADALQGEVQRLMYVHVPAAWLAMLAFFVVFVMSVLYLIQRDPRWDLIAVSSAEIGIVFTALTLVLGSLWGKPTWGVWWTWDPRLTTTAIMLMIYVGYLVVRSFAEDPEKRARWSAIIGIVGFVDVPIVYLSVLWWRTLHQPPSSPRSMAGEFVYVLLLNVAAFTFLYAYLMVRRYRLAVAERQLEELRLSREDRGGR